MRGILEFDLADYDERLQHKVAISANDYLSVLWELDQHLRSQIKYNESLTEEQTAAYEDLRDKLHESLNEHCVDINDLQ